MTTKTIPLSKIFRPDDIDERLNAPHVAKLADSLEDVGLIHPITVAKAKGGYVLVAGRDRLAAAICAGWTNIEAKVVDKDENLALIELDENIYRRHEPKVVRELMRRRVEILAQEFAEEHGMPPSKARAEAVREVADHVGLSERSVQKAVEDAPPESPAAPKRKPPKKKRKAKAEKSATSKTHLDALGVEIPDDVMDEVRCMEAVIDAVSAALERVRTTGQRRLWHEIREFLRDRTPVGVCPWCKAIEALRAECVTCQGTGVGTRQDYDAAPADLLDPDEPRVSVRGQLIAVHALDNAAE